MSKNICHWCNENEMEEGVWGGCSSCPTLPYKCTCDAGNNPHDITCERNPNFAGERRSLGITGFIGELPWEVQQPEVVKKIKDVVDSVLNELVNSEKILPNYEIISCEQDENDKTKFNIVFTINEVFYGRR